MSEEDIEDIPEGLFDYKRGDRLVEGKILTQKEYARRHRIMAKLRPKPKDLLCEICHKNMLQELSNKNHQYRVGKQFINEWQWICVRDHRPFDWELALKQVDQQLEYSCFTCYHQHGKDKVCELCGCDRH